MTLEILYFAWVREHVGVASERLDIPADIVTPLDLARWLAGRDGGYATAFGEPDRLRCAVDQRIVDLSEPMGAAGEVAFFPPVTGG